MAKKNKEHVQKYTLIPCLGVYDQRTGLIYKNGTLPDEVAEWMLSQGLYLDRILTTELYEELGHPDYPKYLNWLSYQNALKDAENELIEELDWLENEDVEDVEDVKENELINEENELEKGTKNE